MKVMKIMKIMKIITLNTVPNIKLPIYQNIRILKIPIY